MCGVYSLRMSLPHAGDRSRCSRGGPDVGRRTPSVRRRGVMSALVTDHLRTVAASGREPVSVLFRAEAAIYGRFGYGLATRALRLTVGRGAQLRPVADSDHVSVRLERLDLERHAEVIAEVLNRVAPTVPGP